MNATTRAQDSLKSLFSHDQPFGPINAGRITDSSAFQQLFDTENRVYSELLRHPSLSLIIGRRGSGKTALLRSALLGDQKQVVLELPAADTFHQLVKTIQDFPVVASAGERLSKAWNLVLWIALLAKVIESDKTS